MSSRILLSAVYTERMRVPFEFMTYFFVTIFFLSTDYVAIINMFFLLNRKILTTHNASAIFAVCIFLVFWKLCETTKFWIIIEI